MDDQSARDDLESIDAIHPDDLKKMSLAQYEKIRDPRRGGLRAGLRVSTDAPRLSQRPKPKVTEAEFLKHYEKYRDAYHAGEIEVVSE